MSLFGLDEMYNELLLEAKSPEEIKKILEYQFVQGKGIPQMVLDKIFEIDPTKKKTYTKWVLMQWGDEKDNIMQSLRNGRLQEMFKYFQERANTGLNLLGMKSFEEAMDLVPHVENDPIFGPIPEDEKDDPKNDFKIVYDTPEWRIAVPNTWQADEKLGQGCRWCTAGAFGNGEYYFKRYTKSGPLWVNFDKRKNEIAPRDRREYPYTRYQFCFESGSMGELCDSDDERINIEEMDIPEDVVKFYEEQEPFYAEILRDSYDSEIAISRYNEVRREHTIFYQPSSVGGPALRLMPTFNEDDLRFDESDPYEVYNDDDIRDSMDGFQYPDEESIFDTCEGYYMLVMQGDGYYGDTALNVYFENITTWGNNWAVEPEVKAYKSSEKGKFFADQYWEKLYFVFASNPSKFISLETRRLPINSIYDAELIDLGDNSDCMWLQVTYEDNFFGLFYADPNTNSVKIKIGKDKPSNGDFFKVTSINGRKCIEGQFKTYWLTQEDEEDDTNELKHWQVEYAFDDDNSYFVVKYTDLDAPRGYLYAIYDSTHKEVIVKDAFEIVEEFSIANITFKDYSILYDYKTRHTVTRPFVKSRRVSNAPLLLCYDDYKNQEHVYIYDDYNEIEHGPFAWVGSGINTGNCITVRPIGEENGFKIYDLDNQRYASDSVYNGQYKLNDCLSVFDKIDGTHVLFNGEIGKEIYEVKDSDSQNIFRFDTVATQPREMLYVFKTIDDKYNIVSARRGVLLPQGVDEINRYRDINKLIPFKNNGKCFFLSLEHNGRKQILPSEQGIDERYIRSLKLETLGDGSVNKMLITLDIDFRLYKVEYNTSQNKIKSIEDVTEQKYYNKTNVNTPVDPKIINKIEQIFFPNKTQISEQFKNIMNRMNNL